MFQDRLFHKIINLEHLSCCSTRQMQYWPKSDRLYKEKWDLLISFQWKK